MDFSRDGAFYTIWESYNGFLGYDLRDAGRVCLPCAIYQRKLAYRKESRYAMAYRDSFL